MLQLLATIWFSKRYRYILINSSVGLVAGVIGIYLAVSIVSSFFDFSFLFGPYGSPDRSSIFGFLEIESSDDRWLALFKAAGNTVSIVIFAIITSSFLGLLVGVSRLSANPILNRISRLYVETFRNLPLLVIMFFFAFATFRIFPQIENSAGISGFVYISNRGVAIPWLQIADLLFAVIFIILVLVNLVASGYLYRYLIRKEDESGEPKHPISRSLFAFLGISTVVYLVTGLPIQISLPNIVQSASGFFSYEGGNYLGIGYISAIISLTLYFSAFIAEIVRGSIQAVPFGQTEAASSIGLSGYQRFSLIILPQALRIMIPALNNEYQNTNKDSTLAHTIAYGEIVLIVNRIVNNSGNLLQSYMFIFVLFIITNLIISTIMNFINKRVQIT